MFILGSGRFGLLALVFGFFCVAGFLCWICRTVMFCDGCGFCASVIAWLGFEFGLLVGLVFVLVL